MILSLLLAICLALSSSAFAQGDEVVEPTEVQQPEVVEPPEKPPEEPEPTIIGPEPDFEEVRRPKTFAMVVGTSSFVNYPQLTRPEAEPLCELIVTTLYKGLPRGDVVALCEPEDTMRAKILAAAQQLGERLQDNDTVIFIFIGVGVGGDYGDPVLLTYDFSPSEDGLSTTTTTTNEVHATLSPDGAKLIMALDAVYNSSVDIIGSDGVINISTIGPIAEHAPEGVLAISHVSDVEQMPTDSQLFGQTLASAFEGDADLDGNNQISPSELSRFMVSTIMLEGGKPPGVNGDWKAATDPIISMPIELPEPREPRAWRLSVNPRIRTASIITGGTMLVASATSWIITSRWQKCLTEPCYHDLDSYNQAVALRDTWAWMARGTGALGIVGLGGGLYLKPTPNGPEAQVSLTARW